MPKRPGRRATPLLLAIGLLLTPVAGADASTLTGGNYDAAPGEVNHLTISYDPDAQTITLADSGAVIQDGSYFDWCTVYGSYAVCNAAKFSPFASLGDGDDTGVYLTALPASQGRVEGGQGNDRLVAGPGNPALRYGGGYAFSGGPGDDILVGSPLADGLSGDDGDDIEIGGAGADRFDGSPSPSPVFNSGAGRDRIYGGPGSDLINGVEPGDQPVRSDLISCGEGTEGPVLLNEPLATHHYGDEASVGRDDRVASDCEYLSKAMVCPAEDPTDLCEIDGVVQTSPRSLAATAVGYARGGGAGAGKLQFEPIEVKGGESGVAVVKLTRKRVKRLLGARRSSTVFGVIRVTSRGKLLRTGKLRFKLHRR